MPFTPTHVLAILPVAAVKRFPLPFSALVIGSMIPDLPLFLPWSPGYDQTHSVAGFPKLARAAARRARITRLVADAGFDSEPNHALARDTLGMRTTIPPTRGRPSQGPPAGKYRRLMKRRFNRRAYRRRWQVETVFSSMKRRQGSAARGRSYWARCRDLWLAVLTHNIMML